MVNYSEHTYIVLTVDKKQSAISEHHCASTSNSEKTPLHPLYYNSAPSQINHPLRPINHCTNLSCSVFEKNRQDGRGLAIWSGKQTDKGCFVYRRCVLSLEHYDRDSRLVDGNPKVYLLQGDLRLFQKLWVTYVNASLIVFCFKNTLISFRFKALSCNDASELILGSIAIANKERENQFINRKI